jgi:hypothetical protein
MFLHRCVRRFAAMFCFSASSLCLGQDPIPVAPNPTRPDLAPAAEAPLPPESVKSPSAFADASAPPGFIVDRERALAMPAGEYPFAGTEVMPLRTVPELMDSGMFVYRAQKMLESEEMLPAANEANDIFYAQLDPSDARMGAAWTPLATLLGLGAPDLAQDIWTRFKAFPSFGAAFDSGVFDVRNIALGKHPGAGQTTFTGSSAFGDVPVSLLFDNQVRNLDVLGAEQVQVYVEANNHFDSDDLRFAHLYARAWDGDRWTLGAGKTYSLFSAGEVTPSSLEQAGALIGSDGLANNNKQLAQLRLQRSIRPGGGVGMGLAIEDPYKNDFTAPGTKLTRWPSFAGNVVFQGDNDVDRLQLSALVRTLGFQDAIGVEHFETAWALSAYARLATVIDEDRLGGAFVGIAGGDGVGQYIHGVGSSAVFGNGQFSTVEGLGAYVGYQRQWVTAGNWELGANAAYGYAMLNARSFMDSKTNEELHEAWANLIVYPNKNVALGLEYHYGDRETLAAGNGENHRIMLVVAIATGRKTTAGSVGFLQGYEYGPSAAAARSFGESPEASRSQASRQSL